MECSFGVYQCHGGYLGEASLTRCEAELKGHIPVLAMVYTPIATAERGKNFVFSGFATSDVRAMI